MKKRLLMLAFLLLTATAIATPASAYLLNWGFDPTGGGDSIITIKEFLNLDGTGSITNDFSDYTFTETGEFYSFSYGPPTKPLSADIYATFTATGELGTNGFSFDTVLSSLKIYTDDTMATLIASFDLLSGGGGARK